jgi:uncharacterized protein YgiM (DUF1202 family)
MRKFITIVLIIAGLGLLAAAAFFSIGYFKPKTAGVIISTNPASIVFVNGEELGRTPVDNKKLEPGEAIIKLIPESFETPLTPYETKINLTAGIQTAIKWDFGETTEKSGGEVVSYEKVDKGDTSLAIISVPDTAQVAIDGQVKGFTPFKTSSISPGEHTIAVSFEGYLDRVFDAQLREGYKLTVVVDLAKAEEVMKKKEEPVVKEEEEQSEVVKILSTSVGFLRVRNEPSTLGEEVGRVEPGDTYEVLETDEDTGWYKIEFEDDEEGWVSNQYAELVTEDEEEEESETSPTPTADPDN